MCGGRSPRRTEETRSCSGLQYLRELCPPTKILHRRRAMGRSFARLHPAYCPKRFASGSAGFSPRTGRRTWWPGQGTRARLMFQGTSKSLSMRRWACQVAKAAAGIRVTALLRLWRTLRRWSPALVITYGGDAHKYAAIVSPARRVLRHRHASGIGVPRCAASAMAVLVLASSPYRHGIEGCDRPVSAGALHSRTSSAGVMDWTRRHPISPCVGE